MLRVLTGVVALSFLAGCGTNVAGTVRRAQAYEDCDSYWVSSGEGTLPQDRFDSMLMIAEASRVDGNSRAEFLEDALPTCDVPGYPEDVVEQCMVCTASIAAVVWP